MSPSPSSQKQKQGQPVRKSSAARRCLFGKANQAEIDANLKTSLAGSAAAARAKWNFDFEADHPVVNGEGDFVFVAANLNEVPTAYHPRVSRRTRARSRLSPEMSDEEDEHERVNGHAGDASDGESEETETGDKPSTSLASAVLPTRGKQSKFTAAFKTPSGGSCSKENSPINVYTPPMTRSHYRQLVSQGSLQMAAAPAGISTPLKKSARLASLAAATTRTTLSSSSKTNTLKPMIITRQASNKEKVMATPKKKAGQPGGGANKDSGNSSFSSKSSYSSSNNSNRVLKQASLTNYMPVRKRRQVADPTASVKSPLPLKMSKRRAARGDTISE